MVLAAACLGALLEATPARATVYFVDGACPTSGAGTSLACGASGPVRTIGEGIERMVAGDTLNVRGAHDGFDGIYVEQVHVSNESSLPGRALACTAAQRCVIQGCRAGTCPTNEQPVVRGMRLRDDWTAQGGGVYARTMEASPELDGQERDAWDPHMLMQGTGHPLIMLAYAGDDVANPGDGAWSYHAGSHRVFVNPVGGAAPDAQVLVPHFSFNVHIESPTANLTVQYLTLEGTRGRSIDAHGNVGQPIAGLVLRGLVQRYVTRHFILANPAPGLLVEDNLSEYGCRGISWALTSGDGCFGYRVFGAHGAVFRRNTLRHIGSGGRRKLSSGSTGWVCPWCDPPWNDPEHTDVSTFGVAFNIKQTSGAVLEDNQIEDITLSGVALDVSRGVTVQRNTIRRSRIAVSMSNFTPTGGCPSTATSQYCYNSDHLIRSNVVHESGLDNVTSCAIDVTGGSERHDGGQMLAEVTNNVIDRPSFAGICVRSESGSPTSDVTIAHNTVFGDRNISPGEPSRGIVVRDATDNVVVRNNLFDGLGADALVLSTAAQSGLSLDGDVIGTTGGCQARWGVTNFEYIPIGGTCGTLAAFAAANAPDEANGRTGAPMFANPGANPPNLHLTAGSAAIEAGVTVAVATDIDGDARPQGARMDAGADEYTGVLPTTTTTSTSTSTSIPGQTSTTATSSTATSVTFSSSTITTSSTSSSTSVGGSSTTTSTLFPRERLQRFVGGNKLLLQDRPDRPTARRLYLQSRDASALVLGDAGDPTPLLASGATLRVTAVGGAWFDETYVLEAAGWKPIDARNPRAGIRYRSKTGPITALVFRANALLRIVGRGAGLVQPLDLEPELVQVELRFADFDYCLEFGGSVQRHAAGRRLVRKGALRPLGCPPD
jgi:hypothetical protein